MTACCFRRERAPMLERVAPGFCQDGMSLTEAGVVDLVTSNQTRECLTDRRDCDPETAALRALGQYLALCERDHGGRLLTFEAVVEGWPDIQDRDGGFPALAVTRAGAAGTYDRALSASVRQVAIGDGLSIVRPTDWSSTLRIEAMANTKEERIGVRMLLEDALTPVDWMNGLRLAVPFYGGHHLEFALVGGGFVDDDGLASQNLFMVALEVLCTVPLWRAVQLPMARPLARGTVVAGASADPVAGKPLSIR